MPSQLQPHNLLKKLLRMQKDLDATIVQLQDAILFKPDGSNRIICDGCGIMNVRVRMDKTYFCRSCGFDSKIKKVDKNEDKN